MPLFATAAKGTEAALRDELVELGFRGVRADRGGVHFDGPRREAYRACLWSRIAVRVLEPVTSFECDGQAALYEGVAAHDFSEVLSPSHTLAVSAASRSSELSHTQYIAQRTKDAIVDRQREQFGERPDVERTDPDVHVFVHLADDFATVYLDHAGAPLHQRGYRKGLAEAPLKETLAAAALRLAGFDGAGPVLDPMCGSGTFLIEAGLVAARLAPGLLRPAFGFERWACFDASEREFFRELRETARTGVRPAAERAPLFGRDIDAAALAVAGENARRAGIELTLEPAPLANVRPPFQSGLLVTNPPYGERLERDADLGRQLARAVDRFPDARAALFMEGSQPLARTRRKPWLFPLFNGNIACVLRAYAPIDRRKGKGETDEFAPPDV